MTKSSIVKMIYAYLLIRVISLFADIFGTQPKMVESIRDPDGK